MPETPDIIELELVVKEENKKHDEHDRHHEGCSLHTTQMWLQDHIILILFFLSLFKINQAPLSGATFNQH